MSHPPLFWMFQNQREVCTKNVQVIALLDPTEFLKLRLLGSYSPLCRDMAHLQMSPCG